MPCHTRMKIILLKALLWLYLWGFSFTVASLEPGFLDFDNLPDTNFSCVGKVIGGYYADLETSCQMFHVCTIGQLDEPMDIRFLCLNGTVFDQETRVCERIDEVDCSKSEKFYSLNLELYGNTQPPIFEDNIDTDPPDILKHSPTTSTTTTTPRPTKPKTTRQSFIITTTQKPPTTTLEEKFLQSHHFPGSNSADIRFNPEEINISLNPGAPPNIRPKPVSFQQSISDNNKRVIVTTHTTVYKNDNNKPPPISTPGPQILETQKPKTIVNYDLNHDGPHPQPQVQSAGDDNYNFDAYQTEKNLDYETEIPHHEISFRPSFRPSSRDIEHYTPKPEYKSSTYRTQYHTTTINPVRIGYSQRGPTTYRNSYSSPLKPALPYYHRTDKPPRIQLPLPLIPTLSPLTFSSPAPFSLSRHVESKRYTDHHEPPRIVISASASVSDASGRKFNYSLGTIGDSRFFGQAPHSYDDYKEDDVGLDPFYHDVPKLKRSRRMRQKRSTMEQSADDIKLENKQRIPTKPLERKRKNQTTQQAKSQENVKNSRDQDGIEKKSQEDSKRAKPKIRSKSQVKVNSDNKRIKRKPQDKTEEEIRSEKEAIDVLKFLFNWYNSHEKMSDTKIPINPETITEINKELSKISDEEYYYDDYDFTTKLELQKVTHNDYDLSTPKSIGRIGKVIKTDDSSTEATSTPIDGVSKREQNLNLSNSENYQAQYNISEGVISITEAQTEKSLKVKEEVQAQRVDRLDQVEYEYVDDNYEPQTYNHTNVTTSKKDYDYDYLLYDKESTTGKNNDIQDFKEKNSDYQIYESTESSTGKNINDHESNQRKMFGTKKSNNKKNTDLESHIIRKHEYQNTDKNVESETARNVNYQTYDEESIKSTNENYDSHTTDSTKNKINNEEILASAQNKSNTAKNHDDQSYNTESNNDYQNYDSESNTRRNNDYEGHDSETNTRKINADPTYDPESNKKESYYSESNTRKDIDYKSNDSETATEKSDNRQQYDLESNTRGSYAPESNTQKEYDNDTQESSTSNNNESKTVIYDNQNYDTYYGNNDKQIKADQQTTIAENSIVSSTVTTAGTTVEIKYDKVLKLLGITTSKPTQNATFDEIPILTPDVTTVSYDQNTEALHVSDSTNYKVPKDIDDTTTVSEFIANTETTLNTDGFTTTSEDLLTITQQGITEARDVETTTALPTTTTTRKHGRTSRRNYGQNKRGKAKKYRKFVELKNEQFSSTITTESYPSTTPTTPDLPDITTKLLEFNDDYGIYSKEYKQDDDAKYYQNSQHAETTLGDDNRTPTESTPHIITTEYDTTLNTLYTTVQLQAFIDKVETNTNSIADTKNLTDTTIEIATVNTDDDVTTELQVTTVENTTPSTTTTKRYESRVANSMKRNRYRGVHRFSVGTTKNPRSRKPSITEEIVDVIKNRMDSSDELSTRKTSRRKKIEFNINAYTANLAYRNRKADTTEKMSVDKNAETTEKMSVSSTHKIYSTTNRKPTEAILVNRNVETPEDTSVTVASFSKSANPTIAKNPKDSLPTTPLSNSRNNINFAFNCIGKAVNKFYSDPRDCRLFHYCTKGFTKTQLLDMKFVCDFGTYFDSEKLICTKDKPNRCT